MSIFERLSEGNPGAIIVLGRILSESPKIDPQAASAIAVLLHLDELGLRGSQLWDLLAHTCGGSMRKTLMLLRAVQLGFLTAEALRHAVENRGEGLDIPALDAKVCGFLSDFQKPEDEAQDAAVK